MSQSDEQTVSRRKFVRKVVAATAITGAGLLGAEAILRPAKVSAASTDRLVSVDSSDTTSDFLNAKVSTGTGITKTILNPGGVEQLQIGISTNNLVSPARQLVWRDSTTTYVRDGSTGVVSTYTGSSRDSTALQAALNGLTSGRTWKETVVVIGGLVGISNNILVSSLTILDLTAATLKVASGANLTQGIITVQGGATDVEIWGGSIDGNRTGQTSNGAHGILFLGGTTRMKVIGSRIQNIYRAYGVYLQGNTSDILLQDVSINGTDGCAIRSDVSNPGGDNVDVRIIRPIITNCSDRSNTDIAGFGGPFDAISTYGSTSQINRRWLIEGADIDGSGAQQNGHGIMIGSMADGRIVACKTFKTRLNGLDIASSIYVKAFGNHFESSGQGGVAGYQNGVQVDDAGVAPSKYCSCSRNTLANNIGNAAVERGTADYNAFADNLLVGNGAGISTIGTHTIAPDNVGTA